MTLNLTIKGRPITKKNHSEIVYAGGHPRVVPSKQYKDYGKLFALQVRRDARMGLVLPCNVKCVYYMPTRHRVDLVNLLEATCDLLVATGVLQDDNSNIVASHDGSRVRYDKERPRVEIEIRPVAEGRP